MPTRRKDIYVIISRSINYCFGFLFVCLKNKRSTTLDCILKLLKPDAPVLDCSHILQVVHLEDFSFLFYTQKHRE